MTNQVNCPNQNPAYSGITINITNPTLNPPGIMPPAPVCSQTALPTGAVNNQAAVSGVTNPAESRMVVGVNNGIGTEVPESVVANPVNADNQLSIYSSSPADANAPQYIVRDGYLVPVSGDNTQKETSSAASDYKAESQGGNVYQNIYNNSKNETKYVNENQNPQSDAGNAYPAAYYLNDYGKNPQNSQDNARQNAGEAFDNSVSEQQNDEANGIITDLDKRAAEQRELEQNGKKTRVVALTNEYIMSLENYLNNPNKEIRLTASKEIIKRLNEDKSRYDDAALNALINKMLQDPDKLIRIAAMSALSSELASGNDYTIQILTNIQQNPNSDQEDVLEASEILLKRAAMTEIRYVKQDNTQPAQKYTMKVRKTTDNQGVQ